MGEGTFREDLYFRLNVITLRIPALRQRPEDILLLAEHFAARFAKANGLGRRVLNAQACAKLMQHSWPGNVRELENTMHRAVLLAGGEVLGAEAIELPVVPGAEPAAPAAEPAPSAKPAVAGVSGLVGRKVEEVERDLILETLTQCLGNRTRAAEILGISIRTLRNKLHEYRAQGAKVPIAPAMLPPGFYANAG